jgi:hypothetical protein
MKKWRRIEIKVLRHRVLLSSCVPINESADRFRRGAIDIIDPENPEVIDLRSGEGQRILGEAIDMLRTCLKFPE